MTTNSKNIYQRKVIKIANLIDGKAVSAKVKAAVREETEQLKAKGITVGLAVVIVGDNPASRVYVNNKKPDVAPRHTHDRPQR